MASKMATEGHMTIFIITGSNELYILATFYENITAIGLMVLEILYIEPI